jgi:hypothetical protein
MRRRSDVIVVSFPDGGPETMRHRYAFLNRLAQAADSTGRRAIRRRRIEFNNGMQRTALRAAAAAKR